MKLTKKIKIKPYSVKYYNDQYKNLDNTELENEAILLMEQIQLPENQTNEKMIELEKKINILRKIINDKQVFTESKNIDLYPYLIDPNFNKKIFHKNEFHQNKIDIDYKNIDTLIENSCNPNKFTLLPTQLFLKNFISPNTPYNGILLYHGTGVGKTCSAITIAEQFKPIIKNNKKKIFVLLSKSIKDGFKKNIFNLEKYIDDRKSQRPISLQCTGNRYFNELDDKGEYLYKMGLNDKIERTINKVINSYYKFMGYLEFANYVESIEEEAIKGYPKEKHISIKKNIINNIFSNSVFIVDEVHHIREKDNSGEGKRVPPVIKRVLTNAYNIKLILLSATPMFNVATEIIWILNLLLINDKRPIIDSSSVFNTNDMLKPGGMEILKKYANGYISYLRGEDPFKFPNRLYPDSNNDPLFLSNNSDTNKEIIPYKKWNEEFIEKDQRIQHLSLVKSTMDQYQMNIYINYLESKRNRNNAFDDTIKIGNIVYPTMDKELIGKFSLHNVFDGNISTGFTYKSKISKEFGDFLSYDTLNIYSTKFKNILDYINNSEGIIYIYSRFIEDGLLPLALTLEQNGYKRFDRFNKTQLLNNDNKLPCKGNYILVTGTDELSYDKDKEIQICTHKNNKDGNDIKIILGSVASGEGIDFHNIREVHILEPWYHLNSIEQAVGRGIRHCSHLDLPLEKRNVTIYLHVAIFGDEYSDYETIDIYRYRKSEEKAIQMAKVERLLKQIAIDCHLNKQGNIFPIDSLNKTIDIVTSQKIKLTIQLGDIDNSSICNYTNCNYQCIPELIEDEYDINNTTNNIIEDEIIDNVSRYLQELYNKDLIYTINDITDYILPKINITRELLYLVLDRIITNNTKISNRNRDGYIIYRDKYYIWQPLHFDETLPLFNRYRKPPKKYTKKLLNSYINKYTTPKIEKNDIITILDDITINIEEYYDKILNDTPPSKKKPDELSYNIVLNIILDSISEIELNTILQHLIHKYKLTTLEPLEKKLEPLEIKLLELLDNRLLYNKNDYKPDNSNKDKDNLFGYIKIDNSNIHYMCYNSEKNIFLRCSKQEENEFNRKRTVYFTRIGLINNITNNKIYGFIDRRMDRNSIFKIVDKENGIIKGKYCTSLNTIHDIKQYIFSLDGTVEPHMDIKNLSKKELCKKLQYILRSLDNREIDGKRWFYTDIEYLFFNSKL